VLLRGLRVTERDSKKDAGDAGSQSGVEEVPDRGADRTGWMIAARCEEAKGRGWEKLRRKMRSGSLSLHGGREDTGCRLWEKLFCVSHVSDGSKLEWIVAALVCSR